MIGQTTLLERISGQISRNKFPRFSILIGERGSGKKQLANEIALGLSLPIVSVGTKVEDIREMIENSYTLDTTSIYLIADCDNMSQAAANSLLKVIEEPPKSAYFIMTCEALDNLLPTIKSRGVTYMLEPYTYENKCDYLSIATQTASDEEEDFMLAVATNMGELQYLVDIDVGEFSKYVMLVVDNIADVSGSNAFKIADRVNLKDDTTKYDLRVFWRAFISVCADKMLHADDPIRYANAIAITGDSIQQLSIRGINKQMLFDNWILSIREEWL